MKKTSKKNPFQKIALFFDKWLITPITKFFLFVIDFFTGNAKTLERIITNRQSLVVISLLFALLTFYIVDSKSTTLVDNSAEVLYGQAVKAIYNEESYVVEGLPEAVDVTLIGKTWDVYLAKQYPASGIIVDLQDLKPGTHKVAMKYKHSVASVQYKLDPSTVTIVIYKKVSEARELSADIIHREKLDEKLNIDDVKLNLDRVIIKGAEYKLNQVATVKALIDIDLLVNPKVGSSTLSDLPLIAYDKLGQKVDVEIVAEKVEATLNISSPSKEVPVKIFTEGELNGKSIRSLTPSVAQVILYGSTDVLEKIEYLPVEIDISGVDKDKEYTINLTKPMGVRAINQKTIRVNLIVGEVVSKEVSGVSVNISNLNPAYKAQALDATSSAITVIVKGSKEVVDAIDSSMIKATVDLSDLGPGNHEVEVNVTGTDLRAVYTPRVKKVKVRITS